MLDYEVKRLERRKQAVISLDINDATCYEVETRSVKDAMLSRPNIVIRQRKIAEPSELIASIRYSLDLEKNRPWYPRMSLTYVGGGESELVMLNPTILRLQWTVDIDGIACVWNLSYKPALLTLSPVGSKDILAVFTYGDSGNHAKRGESVGSLQIISGGKKAEVKMDIICTLAGVMAYWERAGKVLWNDAPSGDPCFFEETGSESTDTTLCQ